MKVNIKQILFLIFLAFHLFVIVCTNVYSISNSLIKLYLGREKPKSDLFLSIAELTFSPPIAGYGTYAGTNTGYGFYSPTVGGQFLTFFYVYDKSCKLLVKRMYPEFQHRESFLRFGLSTALLRKKMMDKRENIKINKFTTLMFHQTAMHIMEDYPDATSVIVRVSLFVFPGVDKFLEGEKEKHLVVDQYSFSRHETKR